MWYCPHNLNFFNNITLFAVKYQIMLYFNLPAADRCCLFMLYYAVVARYSQFSGEVCVKGFLTAWAALFCFCPAARCCSLIGQPVTIRNMAGGGASHTADRGTTSVLSGAHAGMEVEGVGDAGNIQSTAGTGPHTVWIWVGERVVFTVAKRGSHNQGWDI